jgi:hypothetical protein
MFNEPGTDKWYLLTSADHNTIQINRINSDGKVGDRVNRLTKGALEAPGIVKIDGIYYLIVSGKTGYRNNPNQVFWTDKLEGGNWNGPSSIAPNSQDTYNSQNTHEFTVKGSKKTTYIYMGDSWVKGGGAGSGYMWSPMNIDSKNKKLTLDYHPQWKIDVATGEVSWPKKKRRYEAEDASVEGRAAIADCEHCLSKRGVHESKFSASISKILLLLTTRSLKRLCSYVPQRYRSWWSPMGSAPLSRRRPRRRRSLRDGERRDLLQRFLSQQPCRIPRHRACRAQPARRSCEQDNFWCGWKERRQRCRNRT